MMANASQAVCFEPISTTPLEKRGTPSSPSLLVAGLAWPVPTSPQAGPSRERGHGNHPFLPSLCLKMVFPSSYFTYTILQIDGFTGTSGLGLGKLGFTCCVLPPHLCSLVSPSLVVGNHHFMKFSFTNAFFTKERQICMCKHYPGSRS